MEILHSTRSEKDFNRIFFETISVSQWLTGFEWNVFRFLAKIFQGDVNSAVATCPEEDLEVNLISFKITKTHFLSETGQKTLSFFYQIFPGSLVKNALFPSRLTLSRKLFFSENFLFGFLFDFWAGNIRQGCHKMVYFARKTTGESGFYFKWFDSWYRFLTVNNFFRISPDNFQHGC